MTIPLVPPLPDPRVTEFDSDVMVPTWREFWVKLLVSLNAISSTLAASLLPPCLVSQLPSPAGIGGTRGFVTDATQGLTVGIGNIVAGGGTKQVPVFSDNIDWRLG